VWPLDNIALPDLPLAIASAVVLITSGGVVNWAVNGIRQGSNRRLAVGLALTFILGAAALGIQIFDYMHLPFAWNTNAYGSLFFVMGILAWIVVSGGMLINALTQIFAWRGRYTARRHVMAENTAIYWYSAIAFWLVTFGTLYVSPYLL
jgi:cytochrome c oxidase subunit 3